MNKSNTNTLLVNKNNKIKDINDKIDELKQIFNYLEIVNIKDNKV